MEDGERIARDTIDIANAAKDIEDQERGIVADDAELEGLRRRMAEVETDRSVRRDRQRDDDQVIDERSRDLKDALGGHEAPTPPAAAPCPPPPGPETGPVAGPCNPPVTPPRRVG